MAKARSTRLRPETREASMDADNGDAVQRRMTSTESDGRLS